MKQEQFIDRVAELLEGELEEPLQWFYVSFADEEGFRGAAIVEARGITSAILRCNVLGINPHGQAMGLAAGPNIANVPMEARDRLLSKPELESLFGDMKTLGELQEEEGDART